MAPDIELNSISVGLAHASKCAVDASAPDSQLTRDVSDLFALLKETNFDAKFDAPAKRRQPQALVRGVGNGTTPPATPPGGDRLTASIQKGLLGGSIEGDSNERFVGGRRDEGENLHRKRDG